MYGWYAADCDGLWQVCGYMSPPALPSYYELPLLCLLSFGVISV
jgi:hypothetical protein